MLKRIYLYLLVLLVAVPMLGKTVEERVPFNGLIFDALNQPVKGARIHTFDKRSFARSDKQGRFGLWDVLDSDTLHIRFKNVYYDIPVEGRKSIRVVLGDQVVQSADEDEELVDLGYAFVKRRNTTVSSNTISGEMLRRTGQVNALMALQGLVPNLNIRSDGTVTLRGGSSLLLPTTPLFIVDGVEVSSLEFVSVYDVDTVEVLKDASIYGVRGANGAILVHTISGPK